MVGFRRVANAAGRGLVASRLLLSAIVMPTDAGQERIDPAEIDRFSTMGLGEPATIRGLAGALCDVDHNDPADQFLASLDKVLAELLSPTLPIPSIGFDNDLHSQGQFSSRDWSIVLNGRLVANKSKSKEDLLDLFDTLAHELRHAEQFYAAAKYEASAKSRDDETLTKLERRYSLYDYFPDAVTERVMRVPSNAVSETFEFGKLILAVHVNDEIREKKKYIDAIIQSPKVTPDDYKQYVRIVNSKLPSERDATSIEKALRGEADDCLESW